MISQELEERLALRLVNRIDEGNTYILKKIGNAIKQISMVSPSQAYKLGQMLKYGGNLESIVKELSRISGKNVKEIYEMFDLLAEKDKNFAKQFYKYRGLDFIPYAQDTALQEQVKSIATITCGMYENIANTTGIGFLFTDANGQLGFKNMQQTYYEIIDRAVLSITQGKETFQSEMRRIMKEIGHNGVLLYDSGRTKRLDSAVRMNLLGGIRQLNIETTKRIGSEYRC